MLQQMLQKNDVNTLLAMRFLQMGFPRSKKIRRYFAALHHISASEAIRWGPAASGDGNTTMQGFPT